MSTAWKGARISTSRLLPRLLTVAGAAEPSRPAGSGTAPGSAGTPGPSATAGAPPAGTATTAGTGASGGSVAGADALAAVALVAGVAGLARGLAARRRAATVDGSEGVRTGVE